MIRNHLNTQNKKMTKFGAKKFHGINYYEKPTKQDEIKKKATFQDPFLLFFSFVPFCLYYPRPST